MSTAHARARAHTHTHTMSFSPPPLSVYTYIFTVPPHLHPNTYTLNAKTLESHQPNSPRATCPKVIPKHHFATPQRSQNRNKPWSSPREVEWLASKIRDGSLTEFFPWNQISFNSFIHWTCTVPGSGLGTWDSSVSTFPSSLMQNGEW